VNPWRFSDGTTVLPDGHVEGTTAFAEEMRWWCNQNREPYPRPFKTVRTAVYLAAMHPCRDNLPELLEYPKEAPPPKKSPWDGFVVY
jgi:hypothetical protein